MRKYCRENKCTCQGPSKLLFWVSRWSALPSLFQAADALSWSRRRRKRRASTLSRCAAASRPGRCFWRNSSARVRQGTWSTAAAWTCSKPIKIKIGHLKFCPKLKRDENIWQPIILNLNNQAEFKDTLMSPSAEPVTKNSSLGSSARHLTADSCPWNLCRSCRCLTSKMQMSPFLPAEIMAWCCGA